MMRTAAEEVNLCAYWDAHDVKNAEFVRTYRAVDFSGRALVARLEAEQKQTLVRETTKVLPVPKETGHERRSVRHFDDLYGFRGSHLEVHYLSPWEYL